MSDQKVDVWVMGHLVTQLQGQILRDAANNRVRGHASVCGYAPFPYVTMRITFNIPEFTRNERNSHCDVLHIAPVRVANLVLDDAIAAIQTSR